MNTDNGSRLFIGSFLTLVAAGMGFSARAAVLATWGAEYGFTRAELGVITGFGLTGFGLSVMFFSVLVERWGYGVLLGLTFAFHMLSGLISLGGGPVFDAFGKDWTFWCLSIGTTMFAVGNAASEAAINPLIAALHPQERTHRMNILHAGFPGGLVLGALLGVLLKGQRWEVILLTYLVPTVLYGALMLGQRFPLPQAKAHRLSMREMLAEFKSPVLLFLLLLMAMVGFVELGTDSWIANITGNLLADPSKGLYLFIWTSTLMFLLRFCAGPIVHKINPLGLLCSGAVLGTIGLILLSYAGSSFGAGAPWLAASIAVTIYAMGKAFYWPTMLGVVAERFPRGGALTLGSVGCVATLSAGLLGGPAIGFMQDYFAAKDLRARAPEIYATYKAQRPNTLLWIFHTTGLDGSKVAVLSDQGAQLKADMRALEKSGKSDIHLARLNTWWQEVSVRAAADVVPVTAATLHGSRMALRCTAIVPALMVIGYLILIAYFRAQGGYREIHLDTPSQPMSGKGTNQSIQADTRG